MFLEGKGSPETSLIILGIPLLITCICIGTQALNYAPFGDKFILELVNVFSLALTVMSIVSSYYISKYFTILDHEKLDLTDNTQRFVLERSMKFAG